MASNEFALILSLLGGYGLLYLLFFLLPYLRSAQIGPVEASLDDFVHGLLQEKATPGALSIRRSEAPAPNTAPRANLGRFFARWCRDFAAGTGDAEERQEAFAAFLRLNIPDAEVYGAEADGPLYEVPKDAPAHTLSMWLVLTGDEAFLLPRPLSRSFVETGDGVTVEDGLTPQAVGSAIPASLLPAGPDRWQVVEHGYVSAGSGADLLAESEAPAYDADIRTLAPFTRAYDSPFVQEAVQQINMAYPAGDYRHFDLVRLPAYAEYVERLNAARNMAGLFVLFGLGITLFRLNHVVSGLSDMAGEGTMNSETFIKSMGDQLGGIGGAFNASIWGIILMIFAFLVLGIWDWRTQKAFARIERTMVDQALPELVYIQERDLKAATLPQILKETQQNLERLDVTVRGLSDGLDQSLAGLSDRIRTMLDRFGSFDDRYGQLDEVLRATSGAAKKLAEASKTFGGPLGEVQERFSALMVIQNEAIAHSQERYGQLVEEMQALQVQTSASSERSERLLQQAVGLVREQQERATHEQAAQLGALRQGLAQFADGARMLPPAAQSLHSAADVQARVSRDLQASAARFADSGATMRRAAEQFQRNGPQTVPPSLFSWLYNGIVSLKERITGAPPSEWERAAPVLASGDGARAVTPDTPGLLDASPTASVPEDLPETVQPPQA